MHRFALMAVVVLVGVAGTPAAAGQDAPPRLELRFESDGTVTLRALNVSIREILAEWARQCECHVVDATSLAGDVDVPLQFERRSQREVLSSLFRRASGYALTPRRDGMHGPSAFETIYVLPTSQVSDTPYSPPTPVVTPSPQAPASPAGIPSVTPIRMLSPTASPETPEVPPPSSVPPTQPLSAPSPIVPIVPVTPSAGPNPTPEQAQNRPLAPVATPVVTP